MDGWFCIVLDAPASLQPKECFYWYVQQPVRLVVTDEAGKNEVRQSVLSA